MKAMMSEWRWRVLLLRGTWEIYRWEMRYGWVDTQDVDATVRRARFRTLMWAMRVSRAHYETANA